MEGGQCNFGRMRCCITFYRNTISFSVYKNFISACTALSDTIGSNFGANKLLRTCIIIKVTIATFLLAEGLRFHSLYSHVGYLLSYIMTAYKPRNIIIPVELKDLCRLLIKTFVCIEYCKVKELLIHGFYKLWKSSL
jgi:hypothetical protein